MKICLEDIIPVSYAKKTEISLTDPIYILHTSGSTGKPKGVEIPYQGIMNRLYWMNDFFGVLTASAVLQSSRYIYDSAIWELFWPLINGGKTIIMPADFEISCASVCDLVEQHQISIIDLVPSLFNNIFEYSKDSRAEFDEKLKSLRFIIQGGEEMSEKITRQFLRDNPSIGVVNLYGPTEASIGCIYHQLKKEETGRVPIGKPISNVQIHILDAHGNLLPIGIAGELCISGICLANGYVNNIEQSEAKFIFNTRTNSRLYRTGDLGRRLADGNLEYLGRIDNQVKLRGFRIELGEIESVLSGYEGIRESVVVVQERNGDGYLSGYYVSDSAIDTDSLRRYLESRLPDYMIPVHYIGLDRLPVTSNGKLDRKSLPLPDFSGMGLYEGPSTRSESLMVEIWSEVLKLPVDEISMGNSFFELGGHSLKATVLVNRIHREFGVKFPLKEVFRQPVLRQMCAYLKEASGDAYVTIPTAGVHPSYPLSSAQKRLYFLSQYDGSSVSYNIPQVTILEGIVDHALLASSFSSLIDRHEILRTNFKVSGEDVVQEISSSVCFSVSDFTGTDAEVPELVKTFVRPFDLGSDLLIRVGLIRISAVRHVLVG